MKDDRAEGTLNPKPGTQTVDRSVAVLRSFEGAARQTPTEIAHRLGLSVSTAHRIVGALHATGMLAPVLTAAASPPRRRRRRVRPAAPRPRAGVGPRRRPR